MKKSNLALIEGEDMNHKYVATEDLEPLKNPEK
jgi:hypothetical protein